MAATPQYGQVFFRGVSGRQYPIDIYLSDVANANVRFDSGAGASSTSDTRWRCPEAGIIEDVSIHTGTVDTTKLRMLKGQFPLPDVLRYVNFLDTLTQRPRLAIPYRGGEDIAAIQLA